MRPEHWFYTVPLRLRSMFRRGRVEEELDEELQYHLERQIEEYVAGGLTIEQARRAALRAFHGLEQRKEECRDARRVRPIEDAVQDLRYGIRMLRRTKGLTVVAVLTLALGIGATTSIFSVANSILLRPLPFPDSSRLVVLQEAVPKLLPGKFPVSAPDVADFRRLNHVFEDLGAFAAATSDLTGGGLPARVQVTRVSAAVFRMLGARPMLGRSFTGEEDQPGHRVAILGHAIWRERYGADRTIVGKTIVLNRRPYSVVGVMPAALEFPPAGLRGFPPADIWVPIALTRSEIMSRGDNFSFGVLARMRPGVTLTAANADVMEAMRQIQREFYPAEFRTSPAMEASVIPLRELVVGPVRPLVLLLLAAVGLLLLIACANAANLLLIRGTERQKEIAVRVALGAARGRLLRQLLAESTLLALLGGGLGLVAAEAGVKALVALAAPVLPRMREVAVDHGVLLFTLGLSLLCGLFFGTVPALATTKTELNETLKECGGSASAGLRQHRLRDAFAILQLAIAVVLVIASGLLVRSFIRARQTDPGFHSANLLAASVSLPAAQYRRLADVQEFFDRVIGALRAVPGVTSVTASTDLPLDASWNRTFTVEGHEAEQRTGMPTNAHTAIDAAYFHTLGIPLIRGRVFNATEMGGESNVVIISEGMARRYWPGGDAVGRRLKWGIAESPDPWVTIVGVVGDIKQGPLDTATQPHTFEPMRQACRGEHPLCASRFVLVRSGAAPAQLFAVVRAAVRSVDPQQPVGSIVLMDDVVAGSLGPRRFNTFLLAAFAAAALGLAALGVYGVVAYNVNRQTRELGVRIAFGAGRAEIFRHVLTSGLKLASIGVGTGMVVSLALTRVITHLLYQVSATDPMTFGSVALVFVAVALVASWIPGRRATRIDPISALRHE